MKEDKEFIESQSIKCGICGHKMIYIRGRPPRMDTRLTCPQCTQERLEQIRQIADPNYGIVYSEIDFKKPNL